MIDAYPLNWPEAWPRTGEREGSRFLVTLWEATQGVIAELERLGASNVIISSNLRMRRDGLPYADQREPEDSGVAVYFEFNGSQQCIPCDKWIKVKDNMRAIELTVCALRGLDRWGAKEMVNAAFRGFKALPGGVITPPTIEPWYVVLGVDSDSNSLAVKSAYRELIKIHHPDVGGDAADFARIQRAYKEWQEL